MIQLSQNSDNDLATTEHIKNYGNIRLFRIGQKVIAFLGPGFLQYAISVAFSVLLMVILEAVTQCNQIFRIVGISAKIGLFIALLLVGMSNPGIQLMKDQNEIVPAVGRYCGTCKIQRRMGTRHCKQCDTCISNYDHHCPFFGTCIGQGNMLYFKLVMMLFGANMIIAIISNVLGDSPSQSQKIVSEINFKSQN